MSSVILLSVGVIMCCFVVSATRLLNVFIVVENLSILLILCSLLEQSGELFLSLIVLFTVESTLALLILFRLWDTSDLGEIVGR